MTDEQIALARHALGLNGRCKMSYRNRFVAGPGHSDYDNWLAMVEAGEAIRRQGSELTGGDDWFRLTFKGALLALRPGETLDEEDFPEEAP